MTYSKQERIRKELERFYEDRITHYHQQGQHYEAERLASCDIHTRIKEKNNAKNQAVKRQGSSS
jgi:hypothetical protein